jgi:predicted rRNA methylase YqxC with S4 and FtsJ domains
LDIPEFKKNKKMMKKIFNGNLNLKFITKIFYTTQPKIKKLKTKSSKEWFLKKNKDIYTKLAVKEHYRSRAAYKLLEMDQRFKFLSKSSHILELGSSPGKYFTFIMKRIMDTNINKKYKTKNKNHMY